jgi:hypothetical protein
MHSKAGVPGLPQALSVDQRVLCGAPRVVVPTDGRSDRRSVVLRDLSVQIDQIFPLQIDQPHLHSGTDFCVSEPRSQP